MIQLILMCVEFVTLIMIFRYLKLLIATKDLIVKKVRVMENDILEYYLEIEKIKNINFDLDKKIQSIIDRNSNYL